MISAEVLLRLLMAGTRESYIYVCIRTGTYVRRKALLLVVIWIQGDGAKTS